MNERDEFRLPMQIEQALASPIKLDLPSPEVLAKRAVVLSRKTGTARTERYAHWVGLTMLLLACARLAMSIRIENAASNAWLNQFQSTWNELGYVSWAVIFSGMIAGGVIFTIGRARKSLSE